jgi:hypothetical protein
MESTGPPCVALRVSKMRATHGQILRLVGMLIELGCLLPLVSMRTPGRQFAGVRLDHLLTAGVVVGGVVFIAGWFLILTARKPQRL